MQKVLSALCLASAILLNACGDGNNKATTQNDSSPSSTATVDKAVDDKKGVGKFKNVEIAPALDNTMATAGEAISKTKCLSCHKLSDERLVGPGWKDVTTRRTPEWIMNFITNTEEMLSKDPEAIASLEICLVRMPNQNLNDEEARQVYEYMRKNDGVK